MPFSKGFTIHKVSWQGKKTRNYPHQINFQVNFFINIPSAFYRFGTQVKNTYFIFQKFELILKNIIYEISAINIGNFFGL